MKTSWIASLALLGVLAVPSHAIFGIGGDWAPAPGLEVKANTGTVASGASHSIVLDEKGVSGLQGFGVKLWLDAIPLVDFELAGNMQFGYYDVTLNSSNPSYSIPVQFDLGMPGLEGKPFFARAYGDAAILYPFLKLPPLVNILKLYAGGGITYGVATPILSAAFAKAALDKAQAAGTYNPDMDPDNSKAGAIIVNAIQNASYENGLGGFLQLGAHAKIPVIPVAAFVDFKYHFMGFNPDLLSGSDFTMEVGGALAF